MIPIRIEGPKSQLMARAIFGIELVTPEHGGVFLLPSNGGGAISGEPERDQIIPAARVASYTGNATGRPYNILTFRSGESGFTREKDDHRYVSLPQFAELTRTVLDIYKSVYPGRYENNADLTTERVMKSLSNPRAILELVLHGDESIGYGIFPRLIIDGEPIFYSSRAIKTNYEKDGIGTYIFQEAIRKHQVEIARSHGRPMNRGMIMTASAYSVRSLEKLKEGGVLESLHPFDKPYDEIPRGTSWLFGVHQKVHITSKGIDVFGISRKELKELGLNEAFTPPARGTRAYDIHQDMVHTYGLNPLAGDVMYVGFYFPANLQSTSEVAVTSQLPLMLAAA